MSEEIKFPSHSVLVSQADDELKYTFLAPRRSIDWVTVAVFVVYLVACVYLVLLVAYRIGTTLIQDGPDVPGWATLLCGLLIAQMVGIALLTLRCVWRKFVWRGRTREVTFTPAGFQMRQFSGEFFVCKLDDVRGVRVLRYPGEPLTPPSPDDATATSAPPPWENAPRELDATVSILVGERLLTQGLLGGEPASKIQELADDLSSRLSVFLRVNLPAPTFRPIEVIETTAADAAIQGHTVSNSGPNFLKRLTTIGILELWHSSLTLLVGGLSMTPGVIGAWFLARTMGQVIAPPYPITVFVPLGFATVFFLSAWGRWLNDRALVASETQLGSPEPPSDT